jgi:broad specificity phosphatase PhoE
VTKIFIVRHGATDWNHTKRAQGQADIDLNAEGRKQSIKTARELSDEDIVAVYSSDLKRAIDTARPIADAHGLEVVTDPRFKEIDQGDWEGLNTDEIKRRWPDLWGPARHYSARPGGESPQEVRARALDGLKDVVATHPEGKVVLVSHGGTIRWIVAESFGYDDRRSARLRGLGNGAIVCLDAEVNDGRLELANFTRLDGNTPDLDDPND